MKTVGKRKQRKISEHASAQQLVQGAMFNDEIHRLPSGYSLRFPKGIYRYSSHEEANSHWEKVLIDNITHHARK